MTGLTTTGGSKLVVEVVGFVRRKLYDNRVTLLHS